MYFRIAGNLSQNIIRRAERARRDWRRGTVKRAIAKQGSTQERTGMKAKKASPETPSERIRLPRLSEMAKWGGLYL